MISNIKFNPSLKNVKSYVAGKPSELLYREYNLKSEDIIKLASNENPLGVSPKVLKELSTKLHLASVYPDDTYFNLKKALSSKFDINENEIIIGSGSDQIIEFCIRSINPDNASILTSNTTFAMYNIYSSISSIKVNKTKSDIHIISEFKDEYKKHNPNIVFLCTPNNPLGDTLSKEDVYDFCDFCSDETMIVIDGAYMEYVYYQDRSKYLDPKELINRYKNVVILRTFSKAYSLGGMRVGYGIANNEIIDVFYKIRPPFNISSLSYYFAVESLKDENHIIKSVESNFKEMERYIEFCEENDLKYQKSLANFITIYFKDDENSSEIAQRLLEVGIIIRDLSSYSLNAIRITIGLKNQNIKVIESINNLLKKDK